MREHGLTDNLTGHRKYVLKLFERNNIKRMEDNNFKFTARVSYEIV